MNITQTVSSFWGAFSGFEREGTGGFLSRFFRSGRKPRVWRNTWSYQSFWMALKSSASFESIVTGKFSETASVEKKMKVFCDWNGVEFGAIWLPVAMMERNNELKLTVSRIVLTHGKP